MVSRITNGGQIQKVKLFLPELFVVRGPIIFLSLQRRHLGCSSRCEDVFSVDRVTGHKSTVSTDKKRCTIKAFSELAGMHENIWLAMEKKKKERIERVRNVASHQSSRNCFLISRKDVRWWREKVTGPGWGHQWLPASSLASNVTRENGREFNSRGEYYSANSFGGTFLIGIVVHLGFSRSSGYVRKRKVKEYNLHLAP